MRSRRAVRSGGGLTGILLSGGRRSSGRCPGAAAAVSTAVFPDADGFLPVVGSRCGTGGAGRCSGRRPAVFIPDIFAFPLGEAVELRGTVVAPATVFRPMVVGVGISGAADADRLRIVYWTSIVVVASAAVSVVHAGVYRQPAGVHPAIAVAVALPVAGNPAGTRVGRCFPVSLHPYVVAVSSVPRPESLYPYAVGGGGYDGRLDGQHDIGGQGNLFIKDDVKCRRR